MRCPVPPTPARTDLIVAHWPLADARVARSRGGAGDRLADPAGGRDPRPRVTELNVPPGAQASRSTSATAVAGDRSPVLDRQARRACDRQAGARRDHRRRPVIRRAAAAQVVVDEATFVMPLAGVIDHRLPSSARLDQGQGRRREGARRAGRPSCQSELRRAGQAGRGRQGEVSDHADKAAEAERLGGGAGAARMISMRVTPDSFRGRSCRNDRYWMLRHGGCRIKTGMTDRGECRHPEADAAAPARKPGQRDLTSAGRSWQDAARLRACRRSARTILQSLNASINAVWVGRFLGENALAATSNANLVMFLHRWPRSSASAWPPPSWSGRIWGAGTMPMRRGVRWPASVGLFTHRVDRGRWSIGWTGLARDPAICWRRPPAALAARATPICASSSPRCRRRSCP